MKAFNKILLTVIALIVVIFIAANVVIIADKDNTSGRPYIVEASRVALELEEKNIDDIDLSKYEYITGIATYSDDFYNTESDYIIREIGGELYRIEFNADSKTNNTERLITVNISLAVMTIMIIAVLLYVRYKILSPFERLKDVPYELSKGNLTTPVKETKNRFFGRFIWGVDLLRENMEQQKERELKLQKDRKMLLLSLSHDIKTPLSAVKLYSKALSKGLYTDKQKQLEIAESINEKADEIEGYISQIITASREDFLSLDVCNSEFYLSELVTKIQAYYTEKLRLVKTDFSVEEYTDCIIKGDLDRSVEVIQNIIENAIKYGDGNSIRLLFSQEEGCLLFTVENSGCTLSDNDLPHIFDSFWRGENSAKEKGSGLGLYICRQLMMKMNGDIFAKISNGYMNVTAVFTKA
ncbi:MAG: HAMP domain-containing histidine kinase [Oscillospiraceae bacterium]|nr:HAMP domain-containing histidine kinase [Oscillospiraceae bacterium]